MSTKPDTEPRYLSLSDDEFRRRSEELRGRYADCDLCSYDCGVDRTEGQTGACKVDDTAYVSSYFPHRGEEDCLRGWNGSGTVFLSNCNMGCVFCQNAETSHGGEGEPASPSDIADMALELQESGCHNLNFVTPTHHSPHLVEAVRLARDEGLDVPVVWNCGGYERPEILERLDGVVDIYMPDIKWSDDSLAAEYSKAPRYWSNVKESLREMYRQVGDLRLDSSGLATSGLLVRHLVMPNHVENSKGVVDFVAELSEETYLNVMGQYRPEHLALTEDRYAEISRSLRSDEYGEVVGYARDRLERVEYDEKRL